MTDIENWIADYLRREGRAGDADLDALAEENFVERGLIDSLGIVMLIVGVEDEFGVRLGPEQMQDPRFVTIRGLAEIVAESAGVSRPA
jgi:acyl carrier protein